MTADEEFLAWFETTWRDAEVALHNGKPGARDDTWSDREPITLFGAWMNATNADEARAVFRKLEESFADAHDERIQLLAHGVSADLAYTVHREHTTTSVLGEPRDYVLRVTQVYRREDGTWKVAHRHADSDEAQAGP
ncbi:MAG TPA: nuclear transport factor 2 family protein [Nocardioides sp.]|uniref:nuclear transport factor 2 family protein n=1 Tax=Nocardioides sp. TaxID=35761 RepID=UPI002F40D8DB